MFQKSGIFNSSASCAVPALALCVLLTLPADPAAANTDCGAGKELEGATVSRAYAKKVVLYADSERSKKLDPVDKADMAGAKVDCAVGRDMFHVLTKKGRSGWVQKKYIRVTTGQAMQSGSICDRSKSVGAARGSGNRC